MGSGRAMRVGVALAGMGLLSGCLMGDPPPDPEVQPLEIILGNPDRGPCLLNVQEVGAGTHDVLLMSIASNATARIVDPSGAVIFQRAVEPQSAQGGGQVMEEDQVRLDTGDHRVVCLLSDGTHSTRLRVVPARPEHER